jgi:hypothetical protein
MDITNIRLKAHFNYIINRMPDKKKKEQFTLAFIDLYNDEFDFGKQLNDGSKLALDIYREIVQIHTVRFEEGRSGDAYLEKL